MRRGQRQVEQVKIKMGMQMDGEAFRATLLETQVRHSHLRASWIPTPFQVMLTKDHTKWNFDTLLDLIEGPLLNPKRMEEAIKVSRFIRRLTSFFHPFSHRFSVLPRAKVCCGVRRHRYVMCGPHLAPLLSRSGEYEMGQTRMCDAHHFAGESGRCEVLVDR